VIGVVDYKAGNVSSVANALRSISCEFILSGEKERLSQCDGIILPGVGAAQGAMASLEQRQLAGFLSTLEVPFLGICLGMQLLYETSEEGSTKCLGVLPGVVKKFDPHVLKVPHMGWNGVEPNAQTALMNGIPANEHFYFAHSYYASIDAWTCGMSNENISFASVIQRRNYYGVQFHPEKSGTAGLLVLNNFVSLCASSRR
jgi:imidazole glycerol-phosphate synthase subunit HisH